MLIRFDRFGLGVLIRLLVVWCLVMGFVSVVVSVMILMLRLGLMVLILL